MKSFTENEYVIWVELDENCTDFFNKKCEILEKNNINAGIRPSHITITFVRTDNLERLIEYTKSFVDEHTVDIVLNSIGTFTGGVVFYSPIVSNELLQYQSNFCKGVSEFGELSWDLYYPGNWTPHIALTGSLDKETTVNAFSIMLDGFSVMKAYIRKVVIKNSKGEVVFSHLLNKELEG